MAFIAPNFSRRQVDGAGSELRLGNPSAQAESILSNWRASHLYVINTFQSNLRRRKRFFKSEVVIAQRLKRIPTIVDKLNREPGMILSRMHDIAGCRLIFDTVHDLNQFRNEFSVSRSKHINTSEDNRYNYILNPKSSGYRGIHDVYKYVSYSDNASHWNNLRIELQYRTKVQHAWATAVEIVDLINSKRLKFGQADAVLTKQFVIASEILSRYYENMTGYLHNKTNNELIYDFQKCENTTHALIRLKGVTTSHFNKVAKSAKLFILVNFYDPKADNPFVAYTFPDNKSAAEYYQILEEKHKGSADVVLVGATDQDSVKLAYTNYFYDASIFIRMFDEALEGLGGKG